MKSEATTWLSIMAGAAAAVPGSAAAQTTVTEPYTGGPGYNTYVTVCADTEVNPSSENVGVVCLGPPLGDLITVAIADQSGLPVSGYLIFVNGDDRWEYGGPFCVRSDTVRVPPRTRSVQVYLGGPAETGVYCSLASGRPGAGATRGDVHATFASDPVPAPVTPAPPAPVTQPPPAKADCDPPRRVTVRVQRTKVRVNGRRVTVRHGRVRVDLRRYRGRVVEIKTDRRVLKRWRVCAS